LQRRPVPAAQWLHLARATLAVIGEPKASRISGDFHQAQTFPAGALLTTVTTFQPSSGGASCHGIVVPAQSALRRVLRLHWISHARNDQAASGGRSSRSQAKQKACVCSAPQHYAANSAAALSFSFRVQSGSSQRPHGGMGEMRHAGGCIDRSAVCGEEPA
jgi:hypothetical protein